MLNKKVNLTITEAITELEGVNTVCAEISKEDLRSIYETKGTKVLNDDGEEDDQYVLGELQFNFRKDTAELGEILLFPVYENFEYLYNGDFINVTDDFKSASYSVKKFLDSFLTGDPSIDTLKNIIATI